MIAHTALDFLFLFLSAVVAGGGWALGSRVVGKILG